jgi:hypothetical protein
VSHTSIYHLSCLNRGEWTNGKEDCQCGDEEGIESQCRDEIRYHEATRTTATAYAHPSPELFPSLADRVQVLISAMKVKFGARISQASRVM